MKLIVLPIFRILRHHDVIMIYIGNMISDLRSEYQSDKKCLVPNRKFAVTLRLFIVHISFNYCRKGNAEQSLNI